MEQPFGERLISAIESKRAPICVGIDPIYESLPDAVAGEPAKRNANSAEACIDAIFQFCIDVLRVVAPVVPIVKFQSAYFEKYRWEGVEAYYSLIQEAKDLGLLVIGDVKRGDIGSTAQAYAAGHLSGDTYEEHDDVLTPDAITVNPMLGLDTLEPFTQTATTHGKGLFVLLRTSNPGSALLQDVKLEDGRTWSEALADHLRPVAEAPGLMGQSGFSSLGCVVGATQPHTMTSLRARLPKCVFLLPGYGTQGATGDMTRAAFINGRGALVSASRSILYAHKDARYAGLDWKKAVERATLDMKEDVGRFVSA